MSHGLAPALHASQPVPQKLGFMGSESSKPFNDSDPFIGRPESRQECRSYRAVPPSTALLYRLVGTPSGAIEGYRVRKVVGRPTNIYSYTDLYIGATR